MQCDARRSRRDWGETSACEDKQTADSFGVFEDISNLSIKLLRGSWRRMLLPSSAVFVRALLFRSYQISLFRHLEEKNYVQNVTVLHNKINKKTSSSSWFLLKDFTRCLKIIF